MVRHALKSLSLLSLIVIFAMEAVVAQGSDQSTDQMREELRARLAAEHQRLKPLFEPFTEHYNGNVNPEKVPYSVKMSTFLTGFWPGRWPFSTSDTDKILAHKATFVDAELAILSSANRRVAAACQRARESGYDSLVTGGVVRVVREQKQIEQAVEADFVEHHAPLVDALSPSGRELLESLLSDEIPARTAGSNIDWEAFATTYPAEMTELVLERVCAGNSTGDLTLTEMPTTAGPNAIRVGTVQSSDRSVDE